MTALLRGILFCLFLGVWAAVSPAAPPVDFQSSRLLVLGQAASEAARSAPMSVNPADDTSAVPFATSEPFGDACGCDGGMACGSCSDCAACLDVSRGSGHS